MLAKNMKYMELNVSNKNTKHIEFRNIGNRNVKNIDFPSQWLAWQGANNLFSRIQPDDQRTNNKIEWFSIQSKFKVKHERLESAK